jgi:hypothetical protein
MLRRRRVGAASAARRKAGGPRVKGRPAVSVTAWRAIVADLIQRCGSRCEVPWCRHPAALEPHHVRPCSLGGADHVDNVLMVCRACHRRFDAAFRVGKHVAEALGGESFRVALEWRATKWGVLLPGSMQEVYTRPDGTF